MHSPCSHAVYVLVYTLTSGGLGVGKGSYEDGGCVVREAFLLR